MENKRREILIERMNELNHQGKSCEGCPGTCCTFLANSMMITPLEALDILNYLRNNSKDTPELKENIEQTIKKYRLEHAVGNGKRSFIRRTYTCPFFNNGELGCTLPVEVKPYGCLAFNSHHQEKKADEFCFSEKELLERRDELNAMENSLNQNLKKEYLLDWTKAPFPLPFLIFGIFISF